MARRERRGGGAMVRESSGGWWEEVRDREEVLPRRGIERDFTEEEVLAVEAESAGDREEEVGADVPVGNPRIC